MYQQHVHEIHIHIANKKTSLKILNTQLQMQLYPSDKSNKALSQSLEYSINVQINANVFYYNW